jgi:hypothetical protein
LPDRLVFHESFDSTRATATTTQDDPNLAQGQIEAVISLLLGRSLAVNNTYALDSRTFLELADVMLTVRNRVIGQQDEATRERLGASMPFVLFRWGHPNFLAACVDQFRRHDREARNYFRMSAWEDINDNATARTAIAEALERVLTREHYDEPFPATLAAEHPLLARQYETVLRLDAYFKNPDFDRTARRPKIALERYVEKLVNLDDLALGDLADEKRCPRDLAAQVRDAVREGVRQGLDPNFVRGWAHEAVNAQGTDRDEVTLPELVREFVDTAYNGVLADSAHAEFEYMSSVPRLDGRDELKYMNALALGVIRTTRDPAAAGREAVAERTTTRMSGLLSAGSVLPGIPAESMDRILTEYWNLLADPDRSRSWAQSIDLLHEELGRGVVDVPAFRDAWRGHIAQLARDLPRVVAANDGELAITMSNGTTEFVQTQQLGEVDRAALDNALAAGEHLDDLRDVAEGLDPDA